MKDLIIGAVLGLLLGALLLFGYRGDQLLRQQDRSTNLIIDKNWMAQNLDGWQRQGVITLNEEQVKLIRDRGFPVTLFVTADPDTSEQPVQ